MPDKLGDVAAFLSAISSYRKRIIRNAIALHIPSEFYSVLLRGNLDNTRNTGKVLSTVLDKCSL